jgi:hypothetical protein
VELLINKKLVKKHCKRESEEQVLAQQESSLRILELVNLLRLTAEQAHVNLVDLTLDLVLLIAQVNLCHLLLRSALLNVQNFNRCLSLEDKRKEFKNGSIINRDLLQRVKTCVHHPNLLHKTELSITIELSLKILS